jgi:hypothetical protein
VDQSVLVSSGHKLIDLLAAAGMEARAALWVHAPETDTWRLWIVPDKSIKDKRDFYRRVAEVISKHRDEISGIDVADTEFVSETHPAIVALRRLAKVTDHGAVHLANTKLNGFFLPTAIILKMNP